MFHIPAHKNVDHPAGQVSHPPSEGGPDFRVADFGSIYVLYPITAAADLWCAKHLPDDCPLWGANGYAIGERYIADIVDGMLHDGLTCYNPQSGWVVGIFHEQENV